jgi:predicted Zn-dependent protease
VASRFENLVTSAGVRRFGWVAVLGFPVLAFVVLIGSVPADLLPRLLFLIFAGRSALLVAEALRRHPQRDRAQPPAGAVLIEPERLAADPRPGRELAAEWLGLVAFALLFPIDFALFTNDIVPVRSSQGILAVGVVGLCLALYAWPHWWTPSEGLGERRSLWWCLPLVPALALAYFGVTFRHPYLDLRREDRTKLRAERVLSLTDNVVAGNYADWVFAYAAELEASARPAEAADFYRRGLRLAPRSVEPRERLAALERRAELGGGRDAAPLDPRGRAHALSPDALAREPFWPAGRPIHEVPTCRIDQSLERVTGTTVVIVPVGEVPIGIIEAIGDVVHEELGLPACRVAEGMPLGPPTRFRGLLIGSQWSVPSLAKDFSRWLERPPNAPLRYLLVTSRDIYDEPSNFVFSATYPWGAVLSYARFGDPDSEWDGVRHRAAKQSLGALVKSFGLAPSPDPNCVTSYTNGIEQFDAKGNRPNAESYSAFRRRVDDIDRRWRALRAGHHDGS